ncbi:PAS domain-containing protein [Psychrobacter sp. I-STPA6b]|uniref:PAS domain-containing protein n=1 Tax=Psychrobacter sp. I-STPA6b TaxID=2585718 RepID=UPI002222CE06|nr:PAS domain-containing protein [Psychrobacter sp. I-STPA6b]
MGTKIPDMEKPCDSATQYELHYNDGTSRIVYDTGEERPYPDGKLIVSRTDLNGVLTHANDAFVEISGYERDELIGMPHHILRHPDMPSPVYAEMWATLKSGKKWHGYVKNLCKDGTHYWVYATAVPNVRRGETVGYTSVRRKPSRTKIQEAVVQYADMKSTQQEGS